MHLCFCPQDVHHFQLPGYPVWYHTKIRPGAVEFLNRVSTLYELHIFTMGSRMYAHTIARMLDPEGKLFAYRIRSRDECFNAFSKSHDLRLVLLFSLVLILCAFWKKARKKENPEGEEITVLATAIAAPRHE